MEILKITEDSIGFIQANNFNLIVNKSRLNAEQMKAYRNVYFPLHF